MANKPVLFAVDDDREVLRAVERDLRRKYGRGRNGDGYRVLSADSAAAAMDTLGKLTLRGDPVALFLVDQRMPRKSGVEFLEEAKELYPIAKRVLLTAYADTNAAIKAINEVKLDYYLQKPWDPPEENLYPILDDLLGDWQTEWLTKHKPPFEGIRVVGNRWSPRSHAVKDFLARNRVPYQWQDIDASEEARQLVARVDHGDPSLPVVVFPDGTYLEAPENVEVAEKVGLQTRAERPFYDLIIIGGGPSGLAAAVYGASEGLKTVLIEREAPGGQAGTSSRIENYLGFPSGLSGADLSRRAVTQARRFEVEILTPQEVAEVRVENPYRVVRLADGTEISCHALLITTGVSYRKLDVPGVERLSGRGIYYGAAMTEALSCKDEDVYIVGGANSAGQAAMYFSQHARKIVILCRSNDLRKGMSEYLVKQIEETPNIEVRTNSGVAEVFGEDHLEELRIRNSKTGEEETVPAHSLFIFIGAAPKTDWLEGAVERDERGFILSGPELVRDGKRPKNWTEDRDPYLLETSVPGIFVAGDVRRGSVKRVASGVGEGSIAVQFIHQYLAKV
ncbi:MAG: Thioredoxin reductase [uncultured Rubrobacteraceae bacterium]|uniref:Thioredoxin reductase n=1 Tax=uncultured Rubrobacteraceae bacterium TaxID=349277 RepID=A0A6J4R821_9ACTN|nr:MAG: Thioredoxin reductase [uncultured Rubrobacteraceae bacterium]